MVFQLFQNEFVIGRVVHEIQFTHIYNYIVLIGVALNKIKVPPVDFF